jgi:hypothetical protein
MLLAGCVGDFGRSEPSLLAQRVGLDPYVHVPGFAASAPGHLPMTADEAELRLRAYGLTFVYAHEPSYGHATDFAPLMPRNLRHRSFPTAGGYAAAIGNLGHRSPEARLNAIIDDIRADLIQTDHFHRAAVEVYATDANRLHDLRALGAAPAPEGEVVARIEENRFVVERTLVALDERVAGYELAMGESVFGGVGKARAAAVLELDGLRRRVARLGFELARLDARHGLTLPVAEPCTERSLAREC